MRADTAMVLPTRKVPQPFAHGPEPHRQISPIPTQQIGKSADARLFQCNFGHGAHTPDHAHGFVAQEIVGFRSTDHRKSVRFVQIRGDLGEEFVVAEPDRSGQPQLVPHPFYQPRQHDGGRCAMHAGGAPQVHECFVQRQRFDGGGQVFHHLADRAGCLDVGLHSRFDDHRIRA